MLLQQQFPKRYWEDEKWAYSNYTELMKKYPDKWVAVVNKQVVAAGISIRKIKEIARKKTGEELIPVLFIESSPAIYENRTIFSYIS